MEYWVISLTAGPPPQCLTDKISVLARNDATITAYGKKFFRKHAHGHLNRDHKEGTSLSVTVKLSLKVELRRLLPLTTF